MISSSMMFRIVFVSVQAQYSEIVAPLSTTRGGLDQASEKAIHWTFPPFCK
jgi:hypothetical protein